MTRRDSTWQISVLLVVLSVVVAAWPALINRFPILHDDSKIYIGFPANLLRYRCADISKIITALV
jgi:hypothetical protein